jgi:hypothetical protein
MHPFYVFCHLWFNFEPFKGEKMKRITTALVFLATAWVAGAQTTQPTATTPVNDFLQLKQTEYDFGKIPQGKPVYYFFEIQNTGTTPLKLDNVQASCGCTTPEWNHDAIPAGGSDKIKVGYNAATEGPFEKFITITYNGTQKQIKIKGTVWKAPVGSAPANASIQILKQQNL